MDDLREMERDRVGRLEKDLKTDRAMEALREAKGYIESTAFVPHDQRRWSESWVRRFGRLVKE